MKKIFAMLLALVMVLSMVACQPSNAPTTPTDSSKPADNTSTPADPGTTGGATPWQSAWLPSLTPSTPR